MHQIIVNGLAVDVVRKQIKNLHLAVYPPNGRVRVAAPVRISDEAVRLAIISRLSWIKRQQRKFEEQERESEREYVNGESHYFQGSRYRLNIICSEGAGRVVVRNKKYIDLYTRPNSTVLQREKVFSTWYRNYLKNSIPPLVAKWEKIIRVQAVNWAIKRMKTKWGACNNATQRIWLNLELAKKPERSLEYIIVHELVHLLERHHDDNFIAYMDKFMPQWRVYKKELNAFPVSHEDWSY